MKEGTSLGEEEITHPANQRRFSIRKRKHVENLTYDIPLSRGRSRGRREQENTSRRREKEEKEEKGNNKNEKKSSKRSKQEELYDLNFPLSIGCEIILNHNIKENPSFNREVLVVKKIERNGDYVLEMANPCEGFWGQTITKTEDSIARSYTLIQPLEVPLIPIEFSVSNAVYDLRPEKVIEKFPAHSALQGWRWLDSWERLTWTTQPVEFSYRHIYNLAKVAIQDNFDPSAG